MYFIDWFLLDQIRALSRSYDVTVCVQHDDEQYFQKKGINARLVPTGIARKIAPLQDLRALIALVREFRRGGYAIVHSTAPKSGLLGMLAAAFCRVPVRVHTFTGQVWTESRGLRRLALKTFDRLIARLATQVLVDSQSQRQFLLDEKVISPGRSRVLAHGSISGVDIVRFAPHPEARRQVREACAVPSTDLVFLYMARLTRDKGALLMAAGFARYCVVGQKPAHLLIVGPDEEGLIPEIKERCEAHLDRVHFLGYTAVPEKMIAACDVLCLPSYREGFGTVLINAAAGGVPAIAARIYGSEDAVVDGVTGLLHRVGDVDDLVRCMCKLADDVGLRDQLGRQARSRTAEMFSQEIVTAAVMDFYGQALGKELEDV